MNNKTPKQIKLKKLTNLKWINMYEAEFKLANGKEINYNFVSRRDDKHLGNKHLKYVDAIKVLPYFEKDGKTYIVLNREFRYPINSYVYDICAGLVENQNDIENEIAREIKEELGAATIDILKMTNVGHVSPGLTDETLQCYVAKVEYTPNLQQLEESEYITNIVISLDEIPKFVETHNVVLSANLMLQLFYYQKRPKI